MSSPADSTQQTPSDLCREAIRLLTDARNKPPAELKPAVDEVLHRIVALRDLLVERQRATQQPQRSVPGSSLDRVNVAVSLVVGLQYPVGGIERKLIDQACTTLQAALDSGLA